MPVPHRYLSGLQAELSGSEDAISNRAMAIAGREVSIAKPQGTNGGVKMPTAIGKDTSAGLQGRSAGPQMPFAIA